MCAFGPMAGTRLIMSSAVGKRNGWSHSIRSSRCDKMEDGLDSEKGHIGGRGLWKIKGEGGIW